jgi:hypothetical protein
MIFDRFFDQKGSNFRGEREIIFQKSWKKKNFGKKSLKFLEFYIFLNKFKFQIHLIKLHY